MWNLSSLFDIDRIEEANQLLLGELVPSSLLKSTECVESGKSLVEQFELFDSLKRVEIQPIYEMLLDYVDGAVVLQLLAKELSQCLLDLSGQQHTHIDVVGGSLQGHFTELLVSAREDRPLEILVVDSSIMVLI